MWNPSGKRDAIANQIAFLESSAEQNSRWGLAGEGKKKKDVGLLLGFLRAKHLLPRKDHTIKNAYECVSLSVWGMGPGHDSKHRAPYHFQDPGCKVGFPINGPGKTNAVAPSQVSGTAWHIGELTAKHGTDRVEGGIRLLIAVLMVTCMK